MRVLFTTAPLHGHFLPLVPLAWAFHAHGHEVLVATSDHFTPSALHSGLPVTSGGPGMDLHELADAQARHGIRDARYAHGEAFARMAARNLRDTLAIVDEWRPDLVVAERAELAGPIAATARGVRYAELRWGMAELGEYRAAAVPILDPHLRLLRLEALPVPDTVLNPWPAALRPDPGDGQLDLRHVPYNGAARISRWMLQTGTRPRICITLGTVLPQMGTEEIARTMRDLVAEVARIDCEIVVAVDDAFATHLRPLPAAVRHAGRIPLSNVLPTCEVLVHHGGHGTSLTALAAGCPQVVLPGFDDQFENAAAVVASGAGLSLPLEQAAPEHVAEHCRTVLDGQAFATAATAMAQQIAMQPSPADVATVLEGLAHVRHLRSEDTGNDRPVSAAPH
jgi:UDP:flavonoid glycosyltransferase YjiC (YdhE family)